MEGIEALIDAPGPVFPLRLFMPGWPKMTGMAHTLRYDLTIPAGAQEDKPLRAERRAGDTAEAFFPPADDSKSASAITKVQ